MQNGRLPRSALARIAHPTYRVYLRRDAAAAWNSMCLASPIALWVAGAISAYRNYAEQVRAKAIYGDNAATPGTSNHGLGIAVDLAALAMRAAIDRIGRKFGWAKAWSDASWEWWHLRWREGVWKPRPNPGISRRYPVLRKGSGGPGQARFVKEVQRCLRKAGFPAAEPTGEYGPGTRDRVRDFQALAGLRADGVVGTKAWLKLRSRRIRREVKRRRNA